MKLRTLAAACAVVSSLAFAPAAFAAEPVTAKLAQPVSAPTKFIAGGAVFNCAADACVAGATTSQTFAVATCKAIADKVGPVAAFSGRKDLEQDRLADCNAKAIAKAGEATKLAKQ